jgi:hypothetical protein
MLLTAGQAGDSPQFTAIFDRVIYRDRNTVECGINQLEQ